MSIIKHTVTFTDNSKEFLSRSAVFADQLTALMAAGTENRMKTAGEVPLINHSSKYAIKGALRASIRSRKQAVATYVVTAGESSPAGAYAAAQEAGITRGHPIRNYSTPGTGAHFFQHALDNVHSREDEFVHTAARAAGLEII